jgi:hypothetical protein
MMKKITFLLTLTLLLFSNFSFAQHTHTEKCGHNILMQSMEEKYPGYTEAVRKTFEDAKLKGKESREQGRRDIYTIPVVVHVVWHSSLPEQNIADSIIEDQIRVLNEDYRKLNADASNLRGEFDPFVGDAEIEFELQQIIRVSTTTEFTPAITGLDDADEVKSTTAGGSDAVDPESFLNIWICKLQPLSIGPIPIGEILGYAYPPADLPNWPPGANAPTPGRDGVVLDYRTIGSNNPTSTHFTNQGFTIIGRTATHEVGHYLGLRHIWGDPNPLTGENGCTVDDGILDTPNAASNNQATGCNPATNSCGAGQPIDFPDMWENYMDYSQEDCQVAFTNGQIDVLRGVLEGPRSGLLTPPSCTAPVTGNISGPVSANVSTTQNYSVPNSGNTYQWSVTGGTIASGDGTNAIQVLWNSTAGSGQVCIREVEDVCAGDQKCITVTKTPSCSTPSTGAISGEINAETSTTETYSAPANANTFVWAVTGGTIVSGQGTNSISVNWGTGAIGQVCLTESQGACTGNQVCSNITLSTLTGITEIAYSKNLSIYPNPATSFITVQSSEVPNSIELVDILGRVLTSFHSLTLKNTIPIDQFGHQVIFVRVHFNEGFALEKIVVQ